MQPQGRADKKKKRPKKDKKDRKDKQHESVAQPHAQKLREKRSDKKKRRKAAAPATDSESGQLYKKPKLAEPDQSAVLAFMEANEITIHEEGMASACLSLAQAPFPAELVDLLCAQPGFSVPSAVQAATWPISMSGRDVLAIAKTGSGKTLGFLLPTLSRCVWLLAVLCNSCAASLTQFLLTISGVLGA